jgi:hypothetical protein
LTHYGLVWPKASSVLIKAEPGFRLLL